MTRNYHKVLVNIWLEDSGMAIMLGIILIGNFIFQPLMNGETLGRHLNEIIFLLLTFGGIAALIHKRQNQLMMAFFPAMYIIVAIAENYQGTSMSMYTAKIILAIIIFSIIIMLVLKIVFQEGEVNKYKIIASILAFLLIANLFAAIYSFIFTLWPESFNYQDHFIQKNSPHAAFLYFSYTTLTTTGFGDLTPVNPIARSLVTLEQLIGLLYPVILIGRLVSMNISKPQQ